MCHTNIAKPCRPHGGAFSYLGVTMEDRLTASAAARQLGVHRTTVTKWHTNGYTVDGERRHLTDAGPNDAGVQTFWWRELVEAEVAARRNRNSHRVPRRRTLVHA